MTDFVSQLEAELLAAAHRRATRRRRIPRLSPRPFLALATVAAALAAVFALAAPKETQPPATPPSAAFTVPVADRQAPCEPGGQETTKERAPQAVFDAIALLRTRGGAEERLQPTMRGEWSRPFATWLPVGAVVPGSERRPLDTSKLYVLPTADVRTGPIACGPTERRGPGACLIFGAPSDPARFTRCFTLGEIEAGRAFTLVDVSRQGARLLGLVPDGVGQVGFTAPGIYARLPVRENVVQDYIGSLKATDSVTVRLDPQTPRVLVLNETNVAGLAAAARSELHEIGIDAYADTAPQRDSGIVVQVTRPGAELLARRVARLLGGRVESPAHQRMNDPRAPDVVVRIGARMR